MRDFNQSLASVSTTLSGERQELRASLQQPRAWRSARSPASCEENREVLGRNITGLNRVSKVLVKQRGALDEILNVAPVALNNLALTYNPQAGTLDTRANQGQLGDQILADPAAFLCGIVDQADTSGGACNVIKKAFPKNRRRRLRQGGPHAPQDRFDQTLGGLVEAHR